VANIWWDFRKQVEHFTSLEISVTIDREIPTNYNLYVSPCGLANINGLQFYGGLHSNINGWLNATNHERIFLGHGGIFSRWSSDKKTPVDLDNVRVAGPDGLVESAGYEGEFCSVRRPFAWTKGTYTSYYPHQANEPAAPDCAKIMADGEKVRVEIGPIFVRDEALRRHEIKLAGAPE